MKEFEVVDTRSLLTKISEQKNSICDYMPPKTLGRPKGKLAMDACIKNVLSGFTKDIMGAGVPQFIGYSLLSTISQEALIRAGVETIADEATRKFIEFDFDDETGETHEEELNEIEKEFEKYRVREIFNDAFQKDGYFGGCLIYIDVGELSDEEKAEPLILDKKTFSKGMLKGLKVIEPVNIYPAEYNTSDPTDEHYFEPESWYILGKKYHASRFLYICSNPTALLLKPAYNFFGVPRSQMALDYVAHFVENRESAQELLNKFSLTCWQTDLSQMLQGGECNDLIKRVRMFNRLKDNQRTLVFDKEMEDVKQINTPLGGVTEIVNMSLNLLTAVWRIPKIKYIGEGEGGLNASSREQMRSYYDFILGYKEKTAKQPLNTLLKIIQLNIGKEPNDAIKIKFPVLWELDDVEKAQMNKTQADRDALYIANGVLSQEEVRKRLSMDKNSEYNMIDVDDLPETTEEPLKDLKEDMTDEEERIASDMALDESREEEHPRDKDGKFTKKSEKTLEKQEKYDIIKEKENENENTKNEFRRIQEESRGLSEQELRRFHRNRKVDEGIRRRLSEVFSGWLEARSSSNGYGSRLLNNPKTGKDVKFYSDVDAETFHDTFEIVQKYLPSGDAVDVHEVDEYKNCKNYLSENGLSGFSISEDGNLISVFNLGEIGFLRTVAPIIKKEAKFLDCFQSERQPLADMYHKTLGFKPVSELEFNYDILKEYKGKEYADYFVETYGESPVVFMVNTHNEVKTKKFNKDDYDGAYNYQRSFFENTKITNDTLFGKIKSLFKN